MMPEKVTKQPKLYRPTMAFCLGGAVLAIAWLMLYKMPPQIASPTGVGGLFNLVVGLIKLMIGSVGLIFGAIPTVYGGSVLTWTACGAVIETLAIKKSFRVYLIPALAVGMGAGVLLVMYAVTGTPHDGILGGGTNLTTLRLFTLLFGTLPLTLGCLGIAAVTFNQYSPGTLDRLLQQATGQQSQVAAEPLQGSSAERSAESPVEPADADRS